MTLYKQKARSDFRYMGRCGKFLTVVFCIFLLLLGLGQAALGVLLQLDLSKVSDTDFVTILSRINFSGEMVFGVTYLILPKVVLAGAGLALIVAVLGFVAICLEKQRLLVLLAYFALLSLCFQIICYSMVNVTRNKIDSDLQITIKTSFSEYEGVDSNVSASRAWDKIFFEFECCGYDTVISNTDNYHEFNDTAWWARRTNSLKHVPTSCCKSATLSNYNTLQDTNCEVQLLTHRNKAFLVVVPFVVCASVRHIKTVRLFEEEYQ
ncbi:CD151 antigen-like isoform X2 [Dreissena polymorpha]|uniref:CD151 antigen-like isoform X2 n=1 Tax=Dreissena polymorpha TaxID=45954 RepID=UPI002263CFA1|nr:CD151 antigen-like isoform X2 [Dreissena polymorpha]